MTCKTTERFQPSETALCVAWYKAEEWNAWKDACSDFKGTHAEWQYAALDELREMRRKGIVVRRVDVELEPFLTWCRQHSHELSSESRSQFLTEIVQQDAA